MTVEVDPLDERSDRSKLIGQILANRYQIELLLGEGAMGAVYRAKHVKVGRPFAVKILHARLLEDKKIAQRFEREAELAGRLRHPNVIGVVDVGETPEGTRYMVMDFAEGHDLATMLVEAPMTPARIINLVRQLLEGLYHAHEAGLIHRDFKPENVIVERDSNGEEVPRIVDFGIAILREGSDSSGTQGRLTTNGLVLGTPHYMAPEQAVADPIDHRIDLFALGIVIYEMLSGKLPFDGTGAEVARANLLLDPPLIAHRVPHLEVDPLLEAYARHLMAKKRDHRPPTAKAARELLDLIGKDRAAAAAALGVPLHASSGDPRPTTPSPPFASGDSSRASDLEVDTATAAPLAWGSEQPAARRRGWILGGAVAMGVVVAAAVVIGRGGRSHVATTDDPKVVTQATTRDPIPTPDLVAVTPDPDPKASGSDTHASGSNTTPGSGTTEVRTTTHGARTNGKTGSNAIRATPKTGPNAVRATPKTGSNVTTVGTVGKAPEVRVDPKVDPVIVAVVQNPDPAPTAATANQVAEHYAAVGRALKVLQDAQGNSTTSELWPRYRNIKLSEAMSTPQKRAEAMSALSRLSSEIKKRTP